MRTLRALLVDDERLARKRLMALLAAHPQIQVVGETGDLESAVSMVTEMRPDVVFLDVEMPPENGFDLLARLPELPEQPAVVFVTAYETFALDAFAVSAFDYLLKPVHPERLALTLRRLVAAKGLKSPVIGKEEEKWTLTSRIPLTDRQTVRVVEVMEIVAIEALGTYSHVRLAGQPSLIVLRTISEWERRLPQGEFLRIDRSLIVRPRRLRVLDRRSRDESLVTFEGLAEPLKIGRIAAVRLRRHFGAGAERGQADP